MLPHSQPSPSFAGAGKKPSYRKESGRRGFRGRLGGRQRVALDARHHRREAVRTLRGKVIVQPQLDEDGPLIRSEDVARLLSGIEGEQNRDEAAHDMSVAVAAEV